MDIKLTEQQMNILGEMLSAVPYKLAKPPIDFLQAIVNEQIQAVEEAKNLGSNPEVPSICKN